MPLLDGSGNGDAVVMDSVPSVPSPAVDSLPDPAIRRSASNRRQKIVVVGLGMVAISFMYVWVVEHCLLAPKLGILTTPVCSQ